MFNLFSSPTKKHPVIIAAEELIAERSPEAINAFDEAKEQADAAFDSVKSSAEETRKELVRKAYDDENETVGQALTIASNKKEAALKAAVDQIFCNN
ncbi:MAG: hypothetical protein WA087_01525 [Candidatus Saccharimonadales bacterium]